MSPFSFAPHDPRPRCLLIAALFTFLGFANAPAQTVTYTDGDNNSAPIVITSTSTLSLSSGTATQSGVISSTGSPGQLDVNINGTIILTGSNTYTGGTMIGNTGTSATLQIGNGGTTGSILGNVGNDNQIIILGGTNNTTLAFDRSDTVTYAGQISAFVNLTQMGSGTLIYTGTMGVANGFPFPNTPTNTISSGTLQIGNGGTSGNLVGNVTNNSTLVFDRSDTISYGFGGSLGGGVISSQNNIISGTGSVIQAGTGTLALGGINTYTGGTTISAGAIQLNGTLGTGTVVNNASLITTGGWTVANNINGTGSLTQNGTATTVLSGTNSYSGGTAITSGAIEFSANTAMSASGTVTVGSTGTLTVMVGSGNGLFTNGTSGNGSIGGLLSGLGGQAGSTVTWSAGSVLGIDTTNAASAFSYGAIADTSAGVLGITKLGTGTLVLIGNNTYTGATSALGGTLVLTGNNAYAGGTTVSGSATLLQVSTDNNLGAASNGVTLSGGGEMLTTGSAFTTSRAITVTGTDTATLAATAGTTATYTGTLSGQELIFGDGVNTGTIVTGSIAAINYVVIDNSALKITTDGDPNLSGGIGLMNGGELLTNNPGGFTTNRGISVTNGGALAAHNGTTATYTGTLFGGGTLNIGDGVNTGTISFSSTFSATGGNGGTPTIVVTQGTTLDNAAHLTGSEGNNLNSSGTITNGTGGAGVEVDAGGNLIAESTSTITGGTGGGGFDTNAGNGGVGLVLDADASATNNGVILGGQGGSADTGSGNDGIGGTGATVGAGATLLNHSLIAGGAGITVSGPGGVTVGGGGAGVFVDGGSLTNTGTITGGLNSLNPQAGDGIGANLTSTSTLTNSGLVAGGVSADTSAVIINTGTITGDDVGEVTQFSQRGGAATGVVLTQGATLTNQAGALVSGGTGGISTQGNGGTGVTVGSGASLQNTGTITGGLGAIGNSGDNNAGGGGTGVTLATGALFANTGTITGGTGVDFGAGEAGNGGVGVAADVNESFTNNGAINGGNGGSEPDGPFGHGGTAVTLSSGDVFTNHGSVTGGSGGVGDYRGGKGGVGINAGTGATVVNTGTISGGSAGLASALGTLNGFGAQAIVATGSTTILNVGAIVNGVGLEGVPPDAIDLSGGGNTLDLHSTSQITGNVVSSSGTTNGGDTLKLGGATNGTFDASSIGDGAQYQGFANFVKSGTSTWTLTNTTTAVTPWTISKGMLSVSSDAALGDSSGTLTLDGGTLQTTGSSSSTRDVVITANGGTVDTYGTSLALGGTISGPGGLTYNDSKGTGSLTLSGSNSYAGGTNVRAGTLLLANGTNGSATGSGALTVAAGAAIGGAGTSNSTSFAINGTVIAGNGSDATSQLTLTATSASTISDAKLVFNLGTGAQQGESNVLNLGGTPVTFSNTTLEFNLLGGAIIKPDTAYTLITFSSPIDAAADGLTLGANGQIIGGLSIANLGDFGASLNGYNTGFYDGSYLFVDGNNIDLEVVPEPSTWALLALALLLLAFYRRRICKQVSRRR